MTSRTTSWVRTSCGSTEVRWPTSWPYGGFMASIRSCGASGRPESCWLASPPGRSAGSRAARPTPSVRSCGPSRTVWDSCPMPTACTTTARTVDALSFTGSSQTAPWAPPTAPTMGSECSTAEPSSSKRSASRRARGPTSSTVMVTAPWRNGSRRGCSASDQRRRLTPPERQRSGSVDPELSSALTRRPDLLHHSERGTDPSRIDDGQGVHSVIRINGHRGLGILRGEGRLHLAIEVDLPSLGPIHRYPPLPLIDPSALTRVGSSQVWIDVRAIIVELVEQEGAVASQDPHPRPGRRRQRRRTQVGHHSRCMPTSQEGIVLRGCGAGCDLGIDPVDRAEQVDRRIDHVAVQIQQDATAVSRRGILAPPVLGGWTPTFPTELVTEHLTEPTGSDGLSSRYVLGVESAVLEDRQGHTSRSGCVHDPERPRRIRGQRLVDHHRDPGVDALPGLTGVKAARSCQHDEIQTPHLQQGVKVGDHASPRHVVVNVLRALRIGGRDRGDRHTGRL